VPPWLAGCGLYSGGAKIRRAIAGIVVAVVFTVCSVIGQSTFGSIVGVVHDTSQSLVTGAIVKIRSLEITALAQPHRIRMAPLSL